MLLNSYLRENLQHHFPGVHKERHHGGPPQVTKVINVSVNFHHRIFKTSNKDYTKLLYSYLAEHLQHHVPGVHRERHPGASQQVSIEQHC